MKCFLKTYQKYMVVQPNMEKHNIKIKYIPYTFYCVRKPEDKTRWSAGIYVESIRLFVKYPTEYQLVVKNQSLY